MAHAQQEGAPTAMARRYGSSKGGYDSCGYGSRRYGNRGYGSKVDTVVEGTVVEGGGSPVTHPWPRNTGSSVR